MVDPSAIDQQGGQECQAKLLALITRLVGAMARQHPLWLWLDDIQEWDSISISLIHHLALSDQLKQRLTIVATVNLTEAPHLAKFIEVMRSMEADQLPATVFDLAPLDDREMAQVTRAVLYGEVEPSLVEIIVRQSGGIPLAIHTMIQHWLDQGRLQNSSGYWHLTAATEPEGGYHLADSLAAQLNGQSPTLRRLLEALSISKHPWTLPLICTLCGTSPAEVKPWLEQATTLQILIHEQGSYRFLNGATRTIMNNQIGKLMNRLWHRLAADLFEQAGDRSGAELAEHWEKAGHPAQAIPWHRRAAADATSLLAHGLAADHLRKAAELAEATPDLSEERSSLWLAAGDAFQRAGKSSDAFICFKRSAQPGAPPESRAELQDRMATVAPWKEGLTFIGEALASLPIRPPSIIRTRLHRKRSFLLVHEPRYEEAVKEGMTAARLARKLQCPDEEAAAYINIFTAYLRQQKDPQALKWLRRAQHTAGLSHYLQVWVAHEIASYLPNHRQRLALARWVVAEAALHGYHQGMLIGNYTLIAALATMGLWEEARNTFETHRQFCWRCGDLDWVVICYTNWAAFVMQLGQLDEADRLLNRCESVLNHRPNDRVTRVRVQYFLHRQEHDRCIDYVTKTVGDPPQSTPSLHYAAEAWLGKAEPDKAAAWLKLGQRPGLGPWTAIGQTAWMEGRIAELRGQFDQAVQLYQRARRGSTRPWDRVQSYLSEARLLARLAENQRNTAQRSTAQSCADTRCTAQRRARQALNLAQQMRYHQLITEAAGLLAALQQRQSPSPAQR